jgi:hypothetical protein
LNLTYDSRKIENTLGMMDSQIGKKKLHFLLFPWLAQGHINPFLELSKGLAIHGHTVSFLSTPINISRIRPSLQLHNWPGRIDLLELPLRPTEGLTPGAECTADIPVEMAFPLQKAIDGMEKPFRTLLGQLSPDYVVHDFAQYWTQSAAAEMRVPAVYFSVHSAATCGYVYQPSRLSNREITAEELAIPPCGFPCSAISFRLYEARDLLVMFKGIAGHVTPTYRIAKCLQGCVAVAIKSCFEEEDKYIRYFQGAIGVPVLSVGPLMPASKPGEDSRDGSDLLEWLDRQRPSTVVFVSFGSETFLSREQAHELALGLEASGLPFLWSLRAPQFLDNAREDPRELLPEGFEIRTRDRGLVVRGWVPQVRIVSHRSVGGYLSHGGWSSAMEALSFGVPLVLLPVKLDQSLNARQIAAELKAGIEVERGDDGSFLSENIATALRMVMAGEEGKKLRSKVSEARDIILTNTGRQQSYIHDFVQRLEQISVAYKQM